MTGSSLYTCEFQCAGLRDSHADAFKSGVSQRHHTYLHTDILPPLSQRTLIRSTHLAIHSVFAACDNLQVILVSLASACQCVEVISI